jgi:hypothetical protein
MAEIVRWNLKVAAETDTALRVYLGARGIRKGDLSAFVEESVLLRLFGPDIQRLKAKMAKDLTPSTLEAEFMTAVNAFRQRARARADRQAAPRAVRHPAPPPSPLSRAPGAGLSAEPDLPDPPPKL